MACDPALSVTALCVARDLTHLSHETETVHDLSDLTQADKLDPQQFFETTYVTSGMSAFLRAVFDRFTRKGGNPVLCLSQSMGGGKTHNLLAAGLLARYPSIKHKLESRELADLSVPEGIRVLAFSGREHNTAFWESFAAQMGKPQQFRTPEGKLIVPTPDNWLSLFGSEKTLILLDEIPPYFNSIAHRGQGSASVCSVTDLTTAFVSLFGAAARSSSMVVVYTDLNGAVYKLDGEGRATGVMDLTSPALSELNVVDQEASRLVTRIEPIKLGSDEFFGVLRKRLFERLPDAATLERVAERYLAEYRLLKKAGRFHDAGLDADFKAEILNAYPFHPKWRDMYARLSHNPSFQQTRGLLRLVGAQVQEAFRQGLKASLLGPQHLPLEVDSVHRQLKQLNPALELAIAVDVASVGATRAHAAQLDAQGKLDGVATEVATLILIASMPTSTAVSASITENEVLRTFVGPDRDFNQVAKLLQPEGLPSELEHLHQDSLTKRLSFQRIANPNGMLRQAAASLTEAEVLALVKTYLEERFKPRSQNVYQSVVAFPPVQDLRLMVDKVQLVIEGYLPALDPEYRAFYQEAEFKNRVLFLTNSRKFDRLLDDARYFFAAKKLAALPDKKEADPFIPIAKTREANFVTTVQTTYNEVFYPAEGEPASVHVATKLDAGESLIEAALESEGKLVKEAGDKRLVLRIERLMNPKRLKWASVLQKMARDPSFPFVPAAVLEQLKTNQLATGAWRWHSDTEEVERGPFAEQAGLRVELQHLEASGEATLKLIALGADAIHWSTSPAVSRADPVAPELLTVNAEHVYFFPVNAKGTFIDGDVLEWIRPELPSIEVDDPVDRAAHTGRVRVALRQTCPTRASAAALLGQLKDAAQELTFHLDIFPLPGRALSLSARHDRGSENPWTPAEAEAAFLHTLGAYATDPSAAVTLKVNEALFANKAMAESFAQAAGITLVESDFTYVR